MRSGILPEGYKAKYILKDVLSGIIVALVSIPISMGYAQISGLPMIYGLYGSLIPILVYGLLTTSKDFVFGVDAAPAALTGGLLASLQIVSESEEAVRTVPVITLCVAVWLLIFRFARAGRAVKYIATPVMGGFITGICIEIILIQVPKLFGGAPGTGELTELLLHIWEQLPAFNPASFALGIATVVIILTARRFIPKLPMSVVMIAIGAAITVYTPITSAGVKLLPSVEGGLPLPKPFIFDLGTMPDILIGSLTIALVIMSETLLASRQNAINDGYDLDSNREVLAYSIANFSASVLGCCPVNASVSRTSIVRQFGCKSQIMSVSASISMAVILLFCTGFIGYLPVPILTGIVVAALLSACEFHLAGRLIKCSKKDFLIFIAAMAGVLLFGTIYGVLIGVILSFISVIISNITPPRSFMGVIPGRDGFYSLKRNKNAVPVKHAVIYRFGGNIFFANVDTFVSDIENAIRPDTKIVIVYGSGISSIDITAADRLKALREKLAKRDIFFFMTEHDGEVNDELRRYGAGELVTLGNVRLTVDTAFRAAHIHAPYEYDTPENDQSVTEESNNAAATLLGGHNAEIEWAFGNEAPAIKDRLLRSIIENLSKNGQVTTIDDLVSIERRSSWGRLSYTDEDEILERLEEYLKNEPDSKILKDIDIEELTTLIDKRRKVIREHLL
ncbi:MAG: SulP family inorganic anion transporter [Clostridiales bacterium]|nr:SulP family inorganic anion transporter [Clostridiales bacterium]